MIKYLLLFLVSIPTFAGTTGSVLISGVIPQSVSLTVTPLTGYNTLTLTTTQANLAVISVNEQSNDTNGYKVTLVSTNAGQLKNGTLGSITYTGAYNGVAVTLSNTAQTITTQGAQAVIVNVTKNFTINYTGVSAATLMQGTYSDTLTFTLTAN